MKKMRLGRSLLPLSILLLALLFGCGDDGGGDGGSGESSLREILPTGYDSVGAARFSPDGQRLAMVGEKGEEEHLIVTDLKGGGVEVLVTEGLGYLTTLAWAPDGQSLLYSGDGGVLRVGIGGGKPTVVADGFAVAHIDLSPDGAQLAWTTNGGQRFRVAPLQADGMAGDAADGPEGSDAPRFGPGGMQIAYVSSLLDDESGFAVIDASLQGAPTSLPGRGDYLSNAAWIDDGHLLALTEEGIVEISLATGQATALRDAFAATGLDVAPGGARYVYGVNGRPQVMLVER